MTKKQNIGKKQSIFIYGNVENFSVFQEHDSLFYKYIKAWYCLQQTKSYKKQLKAT